MVRSQWRKVHKWIFIFMGLFMLTWLVSGVAIVLPASWFTGQPVTKSHSTDYRSVELPPAAAIASLEKSQGAHLDVASLQLRSMLGRLLYAVRIRGGEEHLVDAKTGEPFEISNEQAVEIAREGYGIESPLLDFRLQRHHDIDYSWGPLPVLRFRFEDAPDVIYLFDRNSAKVSRSTPASRLRSSVVDLHTFGPIRHVTDSELARKALLVLTSIVSLAGAAIGLYLALPMRRRAG